MKRHSILFILLLLLILSSCIGCASSKGTTPQETAAPEEASVEEAAMNTSVTAAFDSETKGLATDVKDISGIFEGLEDNHTALFSFDGAESTFFFEDPAVQKVLSEAVIGSTYTLSYTYDSSTGLNVIYEISE